MLRHTCGSKGTVATITKTPSNTWKALVRKRGWPTTIKTFRTKRDAQDWARRTEDEMVRGVFIQRSASERMTLEAALKRYLADVTPTKKPSTQKSELQNSPTLPGARPMAAKASEAMNVAPSSGN